MEFRTRRSLVFPAGLALVAIALTFVLGRQPRVAACGPFFDQPVFVPIYVPDPPYDKFVAGRLGHVRSTWARLYLTVAYRYLSGRPLDGAEQQAAWEVVVHSAPDDIAGRPLGDWSDARHAVPTAGPDPRIETFRSLGKNSFAEFQNCNANAFETAAAALRARATVPGYDVGEWLRAQDQVFSNCPSGRTIPQALPASAPLLARQDRAYQIAAALFYATDYEAAEMAFRSIARDTTSPWRALAPYLAARCMIRKATVDAPEGSFDKPLLEQAGRELRAFAEAATDARARDMAGQLLGFVDARVEPVSRVRRLGTAIERGGGGNDSIKRSLWDYKVLLDAANGEVTLYEGADERLKRAQSNFEHLAAFRETSDLTDWVITFQATGAATADHALARWRQSHSPAWLVAAIDKTAKDSADVDGLVEAARSIAPASPAYPTAMYHVIRLQLERGREQEARESIDRVLATRPDWPHSSLNELKAWRMALARDLEEFMRFAPRVPAGSTIAGEPRVSEAAEGPVFDDDATAILNHRLPLALLERIATSHSMPDTPREEVGRAAWTRAVLSGNDGAARRLFPFIERGVPVLKGELTAYRAATTSPERQYAALFLLLKSPGLRPSVRAGLGRDPQAFPRRPAPGESLVTLDTLRDNWWCDASEFPNSLRGDRENAPPEAPWPAFLDEAARTAARREDAAMSKLPTAPIVLCDRTVAWAKATPDDARVPEALYLAIRASHYGCWTKATTASSRAAFQLLKTRYATTEWAKETKYYY